MEMLEGYTVQGMEFLSWNFSKFMEAKYLVYFVRQVDRRVYN